MNAANKQLWEEILTHHARAPFGYLKNTPTAEAYTHSAGAQHPIRAEQLHVHCAIENDTFKTLHFSGHATVIAMASASILCSQLTNKPVSHAPQLREALENILAGTTPSLPAADIADLICFSGLTELPNRHPCALLAWNALSAALKA